MSSRQKGGRVAVVCAATVGDEGLGGTIGEVWSHSVGRKAIGSVGAH